MSSFRQSRQGIVWGAAQRKACAHCSGKLGLGTRFRNLWDGRWWVHFRFCSAYCEGLHELGRREIKARKTSVAFLYRMAGNKVTPVHGRLEHDPASRNYPVS
jgi:hypothetical protein